MSKRQWLCILGVWIMFFLFLGVPSQWHEIIAIASGIIIIAISYNLPQEQKSNTPISKSASTFTENTNDHSQVP